MKRLLLLATLLLVLFATSAYAINDAPAPGDESASGPAVGHPAVGNEQADPAGAPFSDNNPGESTGAQGSANADRVALPPNK